MLPSGSKTAGNDSDDAIKGGYCLLEQQLHRYYGTIRIGT